MFLGHVCAEMARSIFVGLKGWGSIGAQNAHRLGLPRKTSSQSSVIKHCQFFRIDGKVEDELLDCFVRVFTDSANHPSIGFPIKNVGKAKERLLLYKVKNSRFFGEPDKARPETVRAVGQQPAEMDGGLDITQRIMRSTVLETIGGSQAIELIAWLSIIAPMVYSGSQARIVLHTGSCAYYQPGNCRWYWSDTGACRVL